MEISPSELTLKLNADLHCGCKSKVNVDILSLLSSPLLRQPVVNIKHQNSKTAILE
jgi:hypothetical protein